MGETETRCWLCRAVVCSICHCVLDPLTRQTSNALVLFKTLQLCSGIRSSSLRVILSQTTQARCLSVRSFCSSSLHSQTSLCSVCDTAASCVSDTRSALDETSSRFANRTCSHSYAEVPSPSRRSKLRVASPLTRCQPARSPFVPLSSQRLTPSACPTSLIMESPFHSCR